MHSVKTSIANTIKSYLQNEDAKNEIKTFLKPFGDLIFNELYFYLLIVGVYCVLLFIFGLSSIFMMYMVLKKFNVLEKEIEKYKLMENLDIIL